MGKYVNDCEKDLIEAKQAVGVRKEIDSLGRLVLPKEMRMLFNLKCEVELVVTKFGILVRNPEYKLVEIEEDK